MTKYVIQSWLSADAVLQKQTDVPAAGRVFDDECHSVPCPPRPEMMLPPGGWMTADFFADVSGQDLGVLKYLIAEVHSDAVVLELDYGNNWKAVPSWDLVSNVEVEWVNGDTATRVSWDFTPFPPEYLDHGFRVRLADTYDFYVGPGVREITKPIAETGWGLSCLATVYLLDASGAEVAQTTSANVCSP